MAELPDGRITEPRKGDLVGKVVTHAEMHSGRVAMRFADGSWVFGRIDGDDDACIDWRDYPEIGDLHDIGVYTDAEYADARAREDDERKAFKLAQLERLRKELGL